MVTLSERKLQIGLELPVMIRISFFRLPKKPVCHRNIRENAEYSPEKGLLAYALAGRDVSGKSLEDIVYEAQRKVILEIADKESCVIIGRNADFILNERSDVLNVFIYGNTQEKLRRISHLYNVSEQTAEKKIADADKRRMANYNFYTGQKWGKASNYTLCLNSSKLGYGRCEEIIIQCFNQGSD